jgi:hypothetical protein
MTSITNPRRKRPLAVVALLTLGAVASSLALLIPPPVDAPATLDGLVAPRGLTALGDGELIVAEGGAGRLLRWDLNGDPDIVSAEFPFLAESGIAGESASGISAALQTADGTYFAIVGEARARGHQELYRLDPSGQLSPVTGNDVFSTLPPLPIVNPYDLVQAANGDLLVTDSGRNAILRITTDGTISDYVLFVSRGFASGQPVDIVPTGAVWGPDGALYVASLTGWPHPPGVAAVYRIVDANGDGDAQDDGEVTVYADGFTAATDIAFDADGALLVTEFSTLMDVLVADLTAANAAELPGRLVRRALDGTTEVLADNLIGPTGVAVVGDRIFVSEEFAGRVREIGTPPAARSGLHWPGRPGHHCSRWRRAMVACWSNIAG